jgi:hypothetical protein
MDLLEDRPISIKASLKRLPEDESKEIKYCLDFDLEKTYNRIYLLKETSMSQRICSQRVFPVNISRRSEESSTANTKIT